MIRTILATALLAAGTATAGCGTTNSEPGPARTSAEAPRDAPSRAKARGDRTRPVRRGRTRSTRPQRQRAARGRQAGRAHRSARSGTTRRAPTTRGKVRPRDDDARRDKRQRPTPKVERARDTGAAARQRAEAAANGPRSTVESLFAALAARDPKGCGLFTEAGLAESTGRSGAAALAKCREDFSRAGGPTPRLNRVEGVRVVGPTAWVQFTSSVGDLAKRQVLRLVDQDGRWRIDGDGSRDVGADGS